MISDQSSTEEIVVAAHELLERFGCVLDELQVAPEVRPEVEIETTVARVVTEGREGGAWVEAWLWVPFASPSPAEAVEVPHG